MYVRVAFTTRSRCSQTALNAQQKWWSGSHNIRGRRVMQNRNLSFLHYPTERQKAVAGVSRA